MAVTEQFSTFYDLYIGVLNAVRAQTSQASTTSQAQRAVNIALQDMHLGTDYQFYWAEREANLLANPSYTTGTVDITQSTTTVTGTDTVWNATNVQGVANVRLNSKIKFAGSEVVYRVNSTPTTTSLEITPGFIGTTLSAATYTAFDDEYALATDYLRPIDLRFFDDNREIALVDRRQLRRAKPRNSITGRPKWATQIELGPSGSTAMRPRLVISPPADNAYIIPYTYVTNLLVVAADGTLKTNFTLDTDEPIVPLRYRHAIYYYALKVFYSHKDDVRYAEADKEYQEIMRRMLSDVNVGDRRMRIEPQVGDYKYRAEHPYDYGSRGRTWDTNSAFDRMQS
jgi:hypothetical protein